MIVLGFLCVAGCSHSEALQKIEHARAVMCTPEVIADTRAFVAAVCALPDAPPQCARFAPHVGKLAELCAIPLD